MLDQNYLIEEESYRDHTIGIYIDDYPRNPIDEFSLLGNYRLDFGYRHDVDQTFDNCEIPYTDDFLDVANFLHDHLVYELSCSDYGCNGGYVGFYKRIESPSELIELLDSDYPCYCFVRKSDIRKDYKTAKVTQELACKIEKIIKSEIKTISAYYEGQVYGYWIEDKDGQHVDSVWGYYGEREIPYMISEAKGIIDHEIEEKQKKNQSDSVHFGLAKFAIV